METYTSLLLLVVPGFITRGIYDLLNKETKIKSPLEETVMSLIFSIFILLINFIIIKLVFNIHTLRSFEKHFKSISFIIQFACITLIVSILIGFLWNILHPKCTMKVINFIRKISSKNKISIDNSVWDGIFDDGKCHALYIEKDGIEYAKGFVLSASSYVNSRELYLEQEEFINDNPDMFLNFKGVYINFDNNIKISEYNLEELYEKNKNKK